MIRLAESLCLFVLLALVVLRPLISETYDSAQTSFSAALREIQDPSPITTQVFNVLILSTILALSVIRRFARPMPYRGTGLECGLVLLTFASVLSCTYAGNRRLAVNASIDWLCYPVLSIALVQLLKDRARLRRVALAAVLASACAQSVHCFDQRFFLSNETWKQYEQMKEEFWSAQGVPLDSPTVDLFERRMKADEATGHLSHSNVAASYLVLCGFVGLSSLFAAFRESSRDRRWFTSAPGLLLCGACFSAATLTGSLGAAVSAVIGAVVWIACWQWRDWIAAHRIRAAVLAWLCLGLALSAVVAHGLDRGSLPGASLQFRWEYWTASANMIVDHPWTGVGRENFGRKYLQYKSIAASEEVSTPHCLPVQAAAEWGLPGLLAVLAMAFGVTRFLVRHPPPTASRSDDAIPACRAPLRNDHVTRPWMWGLAWGVVVALVRVPLLGTDHPEFLYVSSVMVAVPWVIGFCAFSSAIARNDRSSASPALSLGLGAALLTFLIHDLINFALFIPGSAVTFFAVLGLYLAERANGGDVLTRSLRPWSILAPLSAISIVVAVVFALIPMLRSAQSLSRARTIMSADPSRWFDRVQPDDLQDELAHQGIPKEPEMNFERTTTSVFSLIDELLLRAAEEDPWDPTPCIQRAEFLFAAARQAPTGQLDLFREAALALRQAVARDPYSTKLRYSLSRVWQEAATASGVIADWKNAEAAAIEATQLYPNDPRAWVFLANFQLEAGRASGNHEFLTESISHFEQALRIDGLRPAWETIRRLTRTEQSDIQSSLDEARRLSGALP